MCCSGVHTRCACSPPQPADQRATSALPRPRLAARRPPGGAADGCAPPVSKLPSGEEVQSDADAGSPPAADCGRLHDQVDEQTKRDLRTGRLALNAAGRTQLWRAICRHHGAELDNLDEYRDTVTQMEGQYETVRGPQPQRPPFLHPFYRNHYRLDAVEVWTAERVLAVLHYNNPAITYSPPLFSICCLLLHHLTEIDVYNCLCMMLKNSELGFLMQTKRQCEISWRTLVKLCRKHARGSMRFLQINARHGENVRHVLADWIAWIFCFLPYPHVVRLFDCFLMEGEKVLYRAAMALIVLMHRQTSRSIPEDKIGTRWATVLQHQSVQEGMKRFCQEIPVTPRKLLKTMFSIRSFSRCALTASYQKAHEQIRADGGRFSFPERTLDRDLCMEHQSHQGMPSLASQRQLERSSSTIAIKDLLQLWENLPRRYALYSPLLLYTSNEHGFSLKTFYQRVAAHEPTVLLLRTADGAVFGAYCSCAWNTRNQLMEDGSRHAYFGTGETFLFTLRPQLKVYRWVGLQPPDLQQSDLQPPPPAVSRAAQLFMAADNTMLTIGGGGGQAIWLDENLSSGKTDACDTFANPPLTPGGVFEVACMEAFGFSPA